MPTLLLLVHGNIGHAQGSIGVGLRWVNFYYTNTGTGIINTYVPQSIVTGNMSTQTRLKLTKIGFVTFSTSAAWTSKHKLIAAQPARDVVTVALLQDPLTYLHQEEIAHVMAKAVIYRLKVIEIDKGYNYRHIQMARQ